MSKIIPYSFFLLLIFVSCHEKYNNTQNKIATDTLLVKESIIDSSNRLVNKNKSQIVMGDLNKLNEEISKKPTDNLFDKLSTIACTSDGELTTTVDETIKNAFDNHFDLTFNYLFNNKQSCLNESLIQGYSEELSVYEGEERIQKISKLKKENLGKANKLNYSKEQIKYLTKLLDKVKPEIFD